MKAHTLVNINQNYTNIDECSLAFTYSECIGPQLYDKLLDHFHNPKDAYCATEQRLEKIIGRKVTERFVQFRKTYLSDRTLSELSNKSIQVIFPRATEWENIFVYISEKPICLFAKGDISLLKSPHTIVLAIIGSRKPTPYGTHMAQLVSRDVAKSGMIIVSGLAIGIDSIAHKICLEEHGKTVAILGSGIDVPYPSSNYRLYDEILKNGGLILSEYPPGTPPFPSNFVRRNRLISGLSKGLIVIEGSNKSGTLITAGHALDQGKDVFAVPGPITSSLSFAPHMLMQNGAFLITSGQDVIEYYGLKTKPDNTIDSIDKIQATLSHGDFPAETRSILLELRDQPLTAEMIYLLLNKEIRTDRSRHTSLMTILAALTQLEIKSYATRAADGKYYLNSNPTPSIPP